MLVRLASQLWTTTDPQFYGFYNSPDQCDCRSDNMDTSGSLWVTFSGDIYEYAAEESPQSPLRDIAWIDNVQ